MIAACLITRDRVAFAERAVASIRRHVDAVFVYDTGSTDDTVSRLECIGATVERGVWHDDFAWARNQSFAMPGPEYEWLVWIDDDDEVVGPADLHDIVAAAPAQLDFFSCWYDGEASEEGGQV